MLCVDRGSTLWTSQEQRNCTKRFGLVDPLYGLCRVGIAVTINVLLCVGAGGVLLQVPGWEVGKSNSATGRWIPPPKPFGIDDPVLK